MGCNVNLGHYIWRNGEIGQTYDNRIVLYRGEIQQPQFGDPDEPNNLVKFTIEAQPWAQNQFIHKRLLLINVSRIGILRRPMVKAWPIVFGQPVMPNQANT